MKKNIILMVLVPIFVVSLQYIMANESDDTAEIENIIKGSTLSTSNASKKSGKTVSGSEKSIDIALLVEAIQNKEQELIKARDEIEKLKILIKKMWKANKHETFTMYYNMGCAYKNAKQYKKAELMFKKAIDKNPNDAYVHYNLAILYDDDLNDNDKAKYHYSRFLELAPNDRDVAKVLEWIASIP